jgi:cytidine deaminase
MCRQVLCELLNQDTPIYLSNGTEEKDTNIAELLPMQFTMEDVLG